MSFPRGLAAVTLISLGVLSACGKAEPPAPPPDAPRIQRFDADKSELQPGEGAVLTYAVTGATRVELLGPDGDALPVEGDHENGTLAISPDVTSVYVLRAEGPGGSAADFVQIAVGEALATMFLVTVPPEVEPGQRVDLVWSAQGAATAQLADDRGTVIPLEGQSGVHPVTAEDTRMYTLTATGIDGKTATANAQLRVRPAVDAITLEPGVVHAGENVTFKWTTRGANELIIEELGQGELMRFTDPSTVAEDQWSWTVPASLANGHRLEFRVTVRSTLTDTELRYSFVRFVGLGPDILLFDAPEYATPGSGVTLSWRVTGAERVQLFANGLLVYEPRGQDPDTLAVGQTRLPSPLVPTRYELKVEGFGGATAAQSKLVTLAHPPEAVSFVINPFIDDVGDAAQATWSTENAVQVQIRIKNGPVVFSTRNAASVAQGGTALFPGTDTTYVLDAINQAGDVHSREATVSVGNKADLSVSPAHPVPGDTITVSWNLPVGDVQEVLGVLTTAPTHVPMSGQFHDLRTVPASRVLHFATPDDDVSALPAHLAFRFPYAGQVRSSFYVSTNGFLSFEPAESMPDNSPLPFNPDRGTSGVGTRQWLPSVFAPLWTDLEVGEDSQVLFHVVDAGFPRGLIVQWDNVHVKGDGDSKLTFQIQLYETGEARFVYKDLTPGNSADALAAATVGVYGAGYEAPFNGGLNADDQLLWFTTQDGQSSFQIPLNGATRFNFFYRRDDGQLINVTLPVTAWSQDALRVNEVMPQPVAQKGHWVELVNTSSEQMRLDGIRLTVDSNSQDHSFPPGMFLEPGQTLVIGASQVAQENGGVDVGLVMEDFTLAPGDTVTVLADQHPISMMTWTDSMPSASIERPQRVIYSSEAEKTCPREATYGTFNELGTPGEPREPCWDYLLENIAYNPVDIRGSAKVELQAVFTNPRWRTTFLEQPVYLFGTFYEEVLINSMGYVAFDFTPWPHGTGNYGISSFKGPRPVRPNSLIAPYGVSWWPITGSAASPTYRADLAVMWRRIPPGEQGLGSPGEYVFHWNRMAHLSDTTANPSDATFQLRIFDDGVVEMHIGYMQDGLNSSGNPNNSVQGLAEGARGVTWMENPSGTEALAVNVSSTTPGLHPYTSYRFTPVTPPVAPAP